MSVSTDPPHKRLKIEAHNLVISFTDSDYQDIDINQENLVVISILVANYLSKDVD